jgi:hypothetical protein
MNLQHNPLSQKKGTYYKIMVENTYVDDLNKVFIPYRPMLEMELLLSSLLAKENYETLSKFPFWNGNVKFLAKELVISHESVFYTILDRFSQKIRQIVPVTSYTRKIKKLSRFGNVDAYTKSRIPVFYAMDRLKAKLLILRNFLVHLRSHHYLLSSFPCYRKKSNKSFKSILFAEYSARIKEYFETITWEPESKYLKQANQINYKFLCELNRFQLPSTHMDVIYIMRSLRASFLLCKIIFKMLDVPDPFLNEKGSIETLILNRNIIPGMLEALANAYFLRDHKKVREIVDLFEKYLTWMIKGINHGYKIASNSRIDLDLGRTLYYSGKVVVY